jgi:hypothetical protein
MADWQCGIEMDGGGTRVEWCGGGGGGGGGGGRGFGTMGALALALAAERIELRIKDVSNCAQVTKLRVCLTVGDIIEKIIISSILRPVQTVLIISIILSDLRFFHPSLGILPHVAAPTVPKERRHHPAPVLSVPIDLLTPSRARTILALTPSNGVAIRGLSSLPPEWSAAVSTYFSSEILVAQLGAFSTPLINIANLT